MQFQFMPQSAVVQGLLNACLQALPVLPAAEKDVLHKAVKMFEIFGSTPLWSAGDVDASTDLGLTDCEREAAIARFVENREPGESDWAAIDAFARQVLSEREVCIKVEFDLSFVGGDFNGVGQSAFVPLSAIKAAEGEGGEGGAVGRAFQKQTNFAALHIVSYNPDELYNQFGEPIESSSENGVDEMQSTPDAGVMLSKEDLSSMGYQFNEDGDHPGRYYWIDRWSESESTFPNEADAIADASRNAVKAFSPLSRCDNCGLVLSEPQLAEIKNYSMRVEPGGMVPSGQCRSCGCLAYPITGN